MNTTASRRHFLKQTSLLAGGIAVLNGPSIVHGAISGNNKVRIGIRGWEPKV